MPQYPMGIGLNLGLPAGAYQTIDLATAKPSLPVKPLSAVLEGLGLSYARWSFGPDDLSLASLSSAHLLTPYNTPSLSYGADSVAIAAANLKGLTVPFVDALVPRTFWAVYKIDDAINSLATVFGNQADAGIDSTSGTGFVRTNSSSHNVIAVGANNTGYLGQPTYAVNDYFFAAVTLDAQGGGRAMIGGGGNDRIFGRAVQTATLSSNPAAGDTLTIGANTITFVASGAGAGQVNIGATAALTAAALTSYINANTATLLVEATVGNGGNALTIGTNAGGTSGNGMAISKTGTNITLGGATLAGGTPRVVSSRAIGLGPMYSNYYNQKQTLAEFGVANGTLTQVQIQALYAEVKASLSARPTPVVVK